MPQLDVSKVNLAALAPSKLYLTPLLLGSKNKLLADIARIADAYNALLPSFVEKRRASPTYLLDTPGVLMLDQLCLLLLNYVVAKPPGARKISGRQKWHDVVNFKEQIEKHAKYFNIKLLRGDMQSVGGEWNFWFERLDQEAGARNQYEEFKRWLQGATAKTFKGGGYNQVDYFEKPERKKYQVYGQAGRVVWKDQTPLDTSDGPTAPWSGLTGVYIYVCSAITKKIYTAKPEGGMHHSSFLQGQPVIGAGDWKVQNGLVFLVNGASGHYQPTPENLRAFAAACTEFWCPLTMIMPWPKGHDRERDVLAIHDFILQGDQTPVIEPETDRYKEWAATMLHKPEPWERPDGNYKIKAA